MLIFISDCNDLQELTNGNIVYSMQKQSATMSCNAGYILIGQSTLTCLDGTWNSEIPRCMNSKNTANMVLL